MSRSVIIPPGVGVGGGTLASNYLAPVYGVSPANTDNTAAFDSLLATVRATTYGGRIWLEPGPYKFASATTDPGGSPVEIIGCGPGLTSFQCTGGLLSSGNLLSPKRNFHMFDMTLTASTTKSAGSFVRIVGDMLIGDVPSTEFQSYEFVNVNMTNGFDGVTLVDAAGPLGVCGFFWDGFYNHTRGFAAGGAPFVINTPNGVVNKIQNVIHSETAGVAAASRPRATVHMTGAADFRLTGVENVYTVRGLHIDPPASGRVATVFMNECIWGQNTSEAVRIAPNATADCHSLEFTGGYVDTGGMTIVGAAAKAIVVNGVTFLGNTPNDALRLDATVGSVTATGINFAGANAKCFHALNSARNFKLDGHFSNLFGVNTVGIHIEAGCDKYQVFTVGSEYCTTALTEPTPGANSTVTMY